MPPPLGESLTSLKDSAQKNAPKLSNKTKGSFEPMPMVDKEKYLTQLRGEVEKIDRAIRKLEEDEDKNAMPLSRLEARKDMLNGMIGKVEAGNMVEPPLNMIYAIQNFNSKPDMVSTRSELESRKGVIRNADGSPVILYRGSASEGSTEQFKGLGPKGDIHGEGRGVYGSGTYAASAVDSGKGGKPATVEFALETARTYAQEGQKPGSDKRINVFAIKSDANVIQFSSKEEFRKWKDEIRKEAEERTGYSFKDVGKAAAAMGIHAYRIPESQDEDYWVILNRGAVVVSNDPEL